MDFWGAFVGKVLVDGNLLFWCFLMLLYIVFNIFLGVIKILGDFEIDYFLEMILDSIVNWYLILVR